VQGPRVVWLWFIRGGMGMGGSGKIGILGGMVGMLADRVMIAAAKQSIT